MIDKVVIDGNEAVAYAAMDAHVGFFSHYPGSPVSKVEPSFKKLKEKFQLKTVFNDAQNEHIAALSVMGASYANERSMLVLKHVGLNIAADPLVYAGYSGVKGGMVIVVGTDPGANSSTGEQDIHWYASMFNFPLFEPTNVQSIYDNVIDAYRLSEKFEIPVFVFIPVELAHTISSVGRREINNPKREIGFKKDRKRYINVGQKAIENHKILIEKINTIALEDNVGQLFFNNDAKIGLVTRGLGLGYTMESILKLGLQSKVSLFHIDRVFPVHKQSMIDFAKNKDQLIFIEDQDGFLETMVKQVCFNDIDCKIHGKDIFVPYGPLKINDVIDYLSQFSDVVLTKPIDVNLSVEERLGVFCEGCPHTASYYSIFDTLKDVDFVLGGDIGCSSLPPFKADWLLCMNAGIGVSQGIAMVSKKQLVISTGGDGSFFHGGMVSLQSAVENNIDMIHIVFDNEYVAMTGHQYSPSGGHGFNVESFLESIGVKSFQIVDVFEKEALNNALKNEIEKSGVRVIWVKGACALKTTKTRGDIPFGFKVEFENTKCGSCNLCYESLACPAIRKDENNLLFSDENLCVRCGVCKNICPNDAISHTLIQGT